MSPPLVCKLLESRDPVSSVLVCLVDGMMPFEKEWSIHLINEWID